MSLNLSHSHIVSGDTTRKRRFHVAALSLSLSAVGMAAIRTSMLVGTPPAFAASSGSFARREASAKPRPTPKGRSSRHSNPSPVPRPGLSRYTVRELKSRYLNEEKALRAAYAASSRIPIYDINGDIRSQDNGGVFVWGQAIGASGVPSNDPGWLTKKGNIFVNHRNANNVRYQKYYGQHCYVGTRYGTNAFGASVPIKIYGPVPQKYRDVRFKIQRGERQIEYLRNALITCFLTNEQARLKGKLDQRALVYDSGRQALSLRDFLAQHDGAAVELSHYAVAQLTRAAICDAKAKKMLPAGTLLGEVFDLLEPPVRPVGPRRLRMTEADRLRLWGGEVGPNGERGLTDAPKAVFAQHPDLFTQVLETWNAALPSYLSEATPEQATKVLAMSRRLNFVAPAESRPQAEALKTILQRQGQQDSSDDATSPPEDSGSDRLKPEQGAAKSSEDDSSNGQAAAEKFELRGLDVDQVKDLKVDSTALAAALGAENLNKGVYILWVKANSSSSDSDLRVGDVIRRCDGRTISGVSDLIGRFKDAGPGATVLLQITRGVQVMNIQMALPK